MTMRDELEKIILGFAAKSKPTGGNLWYGEENLAAATAKTEALINSRVVEELESLRKQFTEKIADPFKADDWQGNRLRNEQLLKMINITKDRISELTKGGNDEA